jgi:hypothetical protein
MTKSNPPQHTVKKRSNTKKREATAQKRKIPLERQEKKEEIDWKCDSPAYEKPVSPTYGPNSPSYTPAQVKEPVSPTHGPNSPSHIPAQAEEPVSPTNGPDSPSYHPTESALSLLETELSHDSDAEHVFYIQKNPPALLYIGSSTEPAPTVMRVHFDDQSEFIVYCESILLPLVKKLPHNKDLLTCSATAYLEKYYGQEGNLTQLVRAHIIEYPGLAHMPGTLVDPLPESRAIQLVKDIVEHTKDFNPDVLYESLCFLESRSIEETKMLFRLL